MAEDEKIILKKVAPYPIKAMMGVTPQPIQGHILKLTDVGFLIDVYNAVIHVGQRLGINFVLPASQNTVNTMVKVIKTYDRVIADTIATSRSSAGAPVVAATSKGAGRVQRIGEMHFIKLADQSKEHIREFLKAIKQMDHRR